MRFLGPLMVISLAGVFLSTKLEGAPCSGFFVCLYLGLFPFTLYAAHRATPRGFPVRALAVEQDSGRLRVEWDMDGTSPTSARPSFAWSTLSVSPA